MGAIPPVPTWFLALRNIPERKVKIYRSIKDASADEFDAVQLPGGAVDADRMRMVPEVQAFLRAMQAPVNQLPRSVTRLGSWSRPAWCADGG
jgi:hypothetical protein